jgi:hypothetical protein
MENAIVNVETFIMYCRPQEDNIMNTYLLKRFLPYSIAAVLLTTLPLSAMAITETVETAPFIPVEHHQIHPVAVKISEIMGHIVTARTAIRNKALDKAETELGQSGTLLNELQHQYGSGMLSVWISGTHKALNAHTEDAFYTAEMVNLRRLDTAKEDLREGRLAAAENVVDKIDYPLVYAEINIPLQQLHAGIIKAKTLIKQGKPTAADLVLMSAQYNATADASLFGGNFTT